MSPLTTKFVESLIRDCSSRSWFREAPEFLRGVATVCCGIIAFRPEGRRMLAGGKPKAPPPERDRATDAPWKGAGLVSSRIIPHPAEPVGITLRSYEFIRFHVFETAAERMNSLLRRNASLFRQTPPGCRHSCLLTPVAAPRACHRLSSGAAPRRAPTYPRLASKTFLRTARRRGRS